MTVYITQIFANGSLVQCRRRVAKVTEKSYFYWSEQGRRIKK